ncbi:autotransporter outer membrane beta-barrel domain-containing protein [uncultured Microbulbifer sp.]|uniref:autotransporter family protein n=1 Tax=uncultured Microbulbifer sp. TaxID=348147 RepID=UPI0025D32B5C|nr:autotransporter outer membrane beta-barrel domain-containing protein [uncultured Microbulbifer sp.]
MRKILQFPLAARTIAVSGALLLCAFLCLPQVARADCSPSNTGTAGDDQILCDTDNDAAGADVETFAGRDTLDLNGGTIGTVDSGSGDDEIHINGATVEGNLLTGEGNDRVTVDLRESEVGNFSGGGLFTGAGNDSVEIHDGLVFELHTGEGNDQVTLDGGFIFNVLDTGAGDDDIYWDEGIVNAILGGTGSDTLVIDAFAYEGDIAMDGGDDLTADDGDIDTLRFKLDHELDGRLLTNWERIIINGSSRIIFSGQLDVGGGTSGTTQLGLDMRFGSIVEFAPRNYTIGGNVLNAGTLNLRDDRFNTLNIATHQDGRFGNYLGRDGRLWMDVQLAGDGAPADLLTVAGDVSGTTYLRIYNAGGTGALTSGDGIRVIAIDGNSPADAFILDGDYVGFDGRIATVGGAYGYSLHHSALIDPDNGDWYLRSTIEDPFANSGELIPRWQPGAVMYETYAQVIRHLNRPGTLRQRVGNRFWAGTSYRDRGICCFTDATEQTTDGGGLWIRGAGAYTEMAPDRSSGRARWQQDYGLVQLGADFSVDPSVYRGRLILGLFGQYSYADTELDTFFSHGQFDTENYGIGGTATWYGNQGTYVDLQAQFNWYDSDLLSYELYYLASGSDAVGFSFSAEAGHTIKLCDYFALTPQVQLTYNAEELDDISDGYGVIMKDVDNQGGAARFGVAFEQRVSRRKSPANMFGTLLLERINLYAIANALYYFEDETEVEVSGVPLYQARDEWWGQVGAGVTYDECGDRCSFYAEVDYATSFDNPGDSYQASATLGFRFKW